MNKKWIPHFIAAGAFVVFIILGLACASAGKGEPTPTNPYKPLSGIPNATVIGNVKTSFESVDVYYHGNQLSLFKEVNLAAHRALMEVAMQEYSGMVDVADIVWIYSKRSGGTPLLMTATYTATGKVVSLDGSNGKAAATGVEGALARAAKDVLKNVPPRSRIAIVYITALDRSQTEYISGELEVIWVNEGYTIIDRSQLDRIRREQNFQMSGEVDDQTAVSIGKIIGANIIVTGRVDGEGNLRRLRLRALNTQTAQVVGSVSERL